MMINLYHEKNKIVLRKASKKKKVVGLPGPTFPVPGSNQPILKPYPLEV